MLPHEIDPESGARMVGGEIPAWSDEPAPAAGRAIADLVRSSAHGLGAGARVLLAGAPAVALRDHLPEGVRADLLVRGLDDARALARASGTGAGVVAGSLDRLPADAGYDLVVALGGPEATISPDSAPLGGLAWVVLVEALLAPDGVMVASVPNPVGLDRLLAADPRSEPAHWASLADDVPDLLTVQALDTADRLVLAAYPALFPATVLLTGAEARKGSGPAQLAVRALASSVTGTSATTSPWRTADRLLHAGLGHALAPGWVVLRGALPAVSTAPPCDLPSGAVLMESALREAVEGRSHARARTVVTSYAAWLATAAAPAPRDLREVAITPDGRLHPVDRAATGQPRQPGTPGDPEDHLDALGDALAGFAERVCADGTALLWQAPTVDVVVRELLAMAGVDPSSVESPAVGRAARPPAASREAELLRLHAAETALDESRRQVTWLEGTLRARDRRIRTLERAIAVESSPAYKVVHQLARPVPALRRRARAFLDGRTKG